MQVRARIATLVRINEPLVIMDAITPQLLRGQVLVKIFYSGICRSQVMEINGGRGIDHWLPHALGHEGVGEVIAIGEAVTKVVPGDVVILGWIKGIGLDAPGAQYRSNDLIINSGKVTTFSNYSVVSESRVTKKPKKLPLKESVLYGCALPTGAGIVMNELRPKRTDSVIVFGLGGIGISALLALSALEIEIIIAIDNDEDRLRLARNLGATHTINSSLVGFKEVIENVTKGGADMCVESAGKVETIELGFSLINKKKGRLIFASHPPDGKKISLSPHELISGKKISGSWGGGTEPDYDIPKMHNLFSRKNISCEALLDTQYKLENINIALNDMMIGKVLRPLIVMEHLD